MLGRMEGKLDSALQRLAKLEQLEERVDDLERSRSWLFGAGAVIGVIISAIAAFVNQNLGLFHK